MSPKRRMQREPLDNVGDDGEIIKLTPERLDFDNPDRFRFLTLEVFGDLDKPDNKKRVVLGVNIGNCQETHELQLHPYEVFHLIEELQQLVIQIEEEDQ